MAKKPPKRDKCYQKVKASFKVFPSARASQAIAKCRKASGQVRKTSAGASLRQWQSEEWIQQYGKPCGTERKKGKTPYCRPSRRVAANTPTTVGELSKSKLARKRAEKKKTGRGKRVKPIRK
jgi:stalled ribosome alternative rescue factor ArfA